jgi:hypothetical protein
MVNKYQLPKDIFILTSGYNTLSKECSYSFSYIEVLETQKQPGKQKWFDIQKVNGKFTITSTWALP